MRRSFYWGFGMRRRELIKSIGSAALAWPLTARAQPAGKLPTIGFLGADASTWSPWKTAFEQRLSELGWIDGRTVVIEYRWAQGRREREAAIAAEFVGLKVDLIVTSGSAVPAAKQATSDIPIVFAIAVDPVGGGLVTSLARPGGNVTGLSVQETDTAGKRLELLREVVPHLGRLAVMFDGSYPSAVQEAHEVQVAALKLAVGVAPLEIRRAEDIPSVFEAHKGEADALYVVVNNLVSANRARIIASALGARLPTIFNVREYVQAGGLMSYGASYSDLFRQTATIADKILRGAKPRDIPVEQPTKFALVINLTTAKALGLTVPNTLLATADEVIE